MATFFILIPALDTTGPVRGAVALANAISRTRETYLITLKPSDNFNDCVDSAVKVIDLSSEKGILKKVKAYRELLNFHCKSKKVVSISMCFSADAINIFMPSSIVTCSSIRGNLFKNYAHDYGIAGQALALFHLLMVRRVDIVFAMNHTMSLQIQKYLGRKRPYIVENFVDERRLECYRDEAVATKGGIRLIFLGSLTTRKQPFTVIRAFSEVISFVANAQLHIVGNGPLLKESQNLANSLKIEDKVFFHQHLRNPYTVLGKSDLLILPSTSEGVSRAALEALYLGVPCILSNVDGNYELIRNPSQGAIYNDYDELLKLIIEFANRPDLDIAEKRAILLNPENRQFNSAGKLLDICESTMCKS